MSELFDKSGGRAALRRSLAGTLELRSKYLDRGGDPFTFGLAVSVGLHLLVVFFMVFNLGRGGRPPGQEIIYSVTLEGGKTLGGVSQVEKKSDTNVAPPKNVSAAQPEAVEEAKPDEEVVKVKEPVATPVPKKPVAKKKEEPKKAEPKKSESKPKAKEQTTADINKDYQKAMQRYLGESTEAGGTGFGAGRLGGKGMGGGVQRPPEFFTYRQILRDSVKRGWKWYNNQASLVAWVTFEIAPDGTISNVAVAEGSGNREFDESVLRAIVKASPLPPPPASVYNDFRSVRLSFDPRE